MDLPGRQRQASKDLRGSDAVRRGKGRHTLLGLASAVALALYASSAGTGVGLPTEPIRAQSGELATPYQQFGGAMNCAYAEGSLVWLCVGPRLLAMDLSDRSQPRVLGQTDVLPGVLNGLVIEEGTERGWVLAGPVAVGLDLSDPRRPRELGRADIGHHYRPAANVALSGGRLWVVGSEPASVLALDIRNPQRPSALEIYDLVGGYPDRILSLLGRGDRLHVLGYQEGPGGDDTMGRNLLLTFRAESSGGPRLLQSQQVPTEQASSYQGALRWDGDRLWTVVHDQVASWRQDGLGMALAAHGRGGCYLPTGLQIREERLYATCATGFAENWEPMVVDLSRPPDFPVLAEGPRGYDDPGLYSAALALTDGTLWVSNDAGEWKGLDLGQHGSIPSLAVVGVHNGIGEPAYLDWDAPRGRLLASGSDNARAVLVGGAQGPAAGPYLAAGFHIGGLAADADRMVLVNHGDGDVISRRLQIRELTDSAASSTKDPPEIHANLVWGARLPFSLLASDLALLTDEWSPTHRVEHWVWPVGGLPSPRQAWDLPGDAIALDQDAAYLVALSDTSAHESSGPRQQLMLTAVDKRDGRRRDLPIANEISTNGSADLVLRGGRAWVAQSYVSVQMRVQIRILTVDLSGAVVPTPDLAWSAQQDRLWPALGQIERLQASPAGDVLALALDDGHAHLFGIEQGNLQPLAEVALPVRVRDLRFSPDGDDLYMAAEKGGLFELRRPSGGWEALPTVQPSSSPIPDLPSPPTRTPARPVVGLPPRVWLPMLRR